MEDAGETTHEIGEGHGAVSVTVGRDAAGVIISVGTEMSEVLGWQPEELIGRPSTDFIHPEDQAGAITAWFAMLDTGGDAGVWQGRYRSSDGSWRWIESTNVNRLNDESNPIVISVLKRVTVEKVSLTETLRAREQLLTRLSDVLPIGVFQIDAMRNGNLYQRPTDEDRWPFALGDGRGAIFDDRCERPAALPRCSRGGAG